MTQKKLPLWRYVRIAIGVILVAILIPKLLNPDFWTTLRHVNIPLVILALILSVTSVASKAWRWGMVMRWRGINLSLSYLLFSYFIGMFFNNFLPSGFGGDAVRAYETARHTGRSAESIISVVIERGSGMLAVFGAGSLGALIVPNLPIEITLLAHGLFLAALVGIWALWLDVTGRVLNVIGTRLPAGLTGIWKKITEIYEEFRVYRHEWRLLSAVMGQSIITLILTLASVYTLLLAFHHSTSFPAFAAVFSIVTAIDILPISLNGLGVREDSYVYFLGTLLRVGDSVALGVAVLVRLLVFLQAGVGGIAWLARAIRHENEAGHELPAASNESVTLPVESSE